MDRAFSDSKSFEAVPQNRSAFLVVLVVATLGFVLAARGESVSSATLKSTNVVPADARFLRTDGRGLRTESGRGRVVQLRGVNLGGWLEWQDWMCPMDSSGTLRDANPGHNGYNFEVRGLLTRRFGSATADSLIETYLDSWITLADLDQVQALGLNAVRLPFGYDTFLHEDGTWRSNAFQRVDWLVTNAWQRGVYTILDYHAFLPPAASQDGSATGYWANNEQQEETIRIWRRIAEHYRGNPAVAMYDLLNEPNNSVPKGLSAPAAEVVCRLYDRLYRAIREVDPDHIIAMEGVWDWRTLRDPAAAGYRDVAYSFHWYHWGSESSAARQKMLDDDLGGVEAMRRVWEVPVYIGEFNFFGDWQLWKKGLARFDEGGLNWTLWTLKNKKSGDNSWGVLTTIPGKVREVPNLTTDSADTIREKWRNWRTRSEVFGLNPRFKQVLIEQTRSRRPGYRQET
jgi:aryl-phospho-beta-D-glucosidase BglC (GH1 family)